MNRTRPPWRVAALIRAEMEAAALAVGVPVPVRIDPAPPPSAWDEMTALRWGPGVADPTPGIVIDRPDRGRLRTAQLAADRNDAYASAERTALQDEATH